MTVNNAIEVLQKIQEKNNGKVLKKKTIALGCARLGYTDFIVKAGTLEELKKFDFGSAPHCLIIPGKMHFLEEEMLKLWK